MVSGVQLVEGVTLYIQLGFILRTSGKRRNTFAALRWVL